MKLGRRAPHRRLAGTQASPHLDRLVIIRHLGATRPLLNTGTLGRPWLNTGTLGRPCVLLHFATMQRVRRKLGLTQLACGVSRRACCEAQEMRHMAICHHALGPLPAHSSPQPDSPERAEPSSAALGAVLLVSGASICLGRPPTHLRVWDVSLAEGGLPLLASSVPVDGHIPHSLQPQLPPDRGCITHVAVHKHSLEGLHV
jgi:hypothetical protein